MKVFVLSKLFLMSDFAKKKRKKSLDYLVYASFSFIVKKNYFLPENEGIVLADKT